MASEGKAQTSSEYIQHHLQNLQVCRADGEWVWNHCAGNPMAINVDSMFFSIILGLIFICLFRGVAKKASSSNGAIPNTVVSAARITGLARLSDASITACI